MLNAILIVTALLLGAILLSKRIRDNTSWRSTVTPLASIIGSGFLVIVPLLGNAVGGYAPLAMMVVLLIAYAVGAAIRFNIVHVEPILRAPSAGATAGARTSTRLVHQLEFVSTIALSLAYFISVTFYLRLLSSFVLHGFEIEGDFVAQIITTAILLFIGLTGWIHGLSFLERLEEYSVSIKLAIIASLLLGWAIYDLSLLGESNLTIAFPADLNLWHVARLLAGVLIVVQGFETSRYLGEDYDAKTRVVTMRRAQIISGVIYLVFVLLTVPSFGLLGDDVSETAIIDLSKVVASVLPYMLVIAAVMSQLSAAVADTIGTGGLFAETIGKRFKLPTRLGYLLVAAVGTVLVWTTDIFEIVALASRAFAFYYGLQSLLAAVVALQHPAEGKRRLGLVVGFGFLAILLFVAAAIAIPAG